MYSFSDSEFWYSFLTLFVNYESFTGINAKNGKPYTNRLYSIASTRYGDDMKVKADTMPNYPIFLL